MTTFTIADMPNLTLLTINNLRWIWTTVMTTWTTWTFQMMGVTIEGRVRLTLIQAQSMLRARNHRKESVVMPTSRCWIACYTWRHSSWLLPTTRLRNTRLCSSITCSLDCLWLGQQWLYFTPWSSSYLNAVADLQRPQSHGKRRKMVKNITVIWARVQRQVKGKKVIE